MTKNTILLFSMLLTFVLGCTPPPPSGPDPDHIIYLDDGDSLTCKLLLGETKFQAQPLELFILHYLPQGVL